jgi:5-methylcytosine-specific restriction protein B
MTDAHIQTYNREVQPINDARATWDFANVVSEGDEVIAKRGRHTIVGRGIVESAYSFDGNRANMKHVRLIRWTHRGEWTLNSILPIKTLTDVTDATELVETIHEAMSVGAADPVAPVPTNQRTPYSVDQAMTGLFMPRAEFEAALGVWRSKRNLILQGAPGVGKSFVARKLAYAIMGYNDPSRVRTIQFHQAYAYEDFVQGYRPNGTGGFTLKKGVFVEFCRRALADPNQSYVFIIDEINRGNLSKILGELMLLMESDKRSPEWAVKLAYGDKADERFFVPLNLYVLGMMNTADRSLAVVDYALRRRFAFRSIRPGFGEPSFVSHLADRGISQTMILKIQSRMESLNDAIATDRSNLGPGFCIGHSFFSTPPPLEDMDVDEKTELERAWFLQVIDSEIIPLLEEDCFDDPGKADEWSQALRS